jgi:phosphoglycerol transferase
MVLVILEYASGQFDAYFKTNKTRWFFYCVIAAVTSMSGIYYSYFSCLFISVAIIYRYSKDRIPRSVLPGLLLIGIIVVSGLISISSTLFYRIENGKNQYGIMRVYHEVELYSLKITDLLLPAKGHRVHFLSDLKQKYDDESSYLYRFSHGEKDIALGFFGSMGFMLLIFFVLFNRNSSFIKDNESSEIVSILSVLNLLAVLLSVIGGFNSFLAPFLNYSIRAYNRIVVFIAFFSISAMLIVLNDIYKNHMIYNLVKKQKSMRAINAVKLILSIFIVILMIFGIYDQSADGSIPEYKEIIEKYKNDSEFVRAIEKIMPAGTRVFQLPYAQYPECQPVNQMPEYSHMRYYLHTKNLRWSYGAMKGREDDGWQKRAASLDPKEMLRNIKQKKFDGLLIDKRGYSDGGNSLISEITKIIGRNPIFDAKKEVVFFDIREPEKHALHILSSR